MLRLLPEAGAGSKQTMMCTHGSMYELCTLILTKRFAFGNIILMKVW